MSGGAQNKKRDYAAEIDQLKKQFAEEGANWAEAKRRLGEQEIRGPGYRSVEQSAQERQAGITPPGYEGLRDINTRELLDVYKSDPYAGEALQKLKEQAFAEGDSPWAKLQLESQGLEESRARDQAARSQAQGLAQAQANLMRQGGLSSGARERMAQTGARDLMFAQQGVAGQGMADRLGIQQQDLGRKTDLLKRFGDAESAARESNIGRTIGDVEKSGLFDVERYKQQMAAYGAKQSADAQRSAGGRGGKK